MKRCSQCSSIYSDDALTFCLADGAQLHPFEGLETVVISASNTQIEQNVPRSLRGPAIGLISSGVINIIWTSIWIFSNSVGFLKEENRNFTTDGQRIAGTTGYVLGSMFLVLGLALAPMIIYAALQMLKGEKYRLAKTAAILSIIPCTSCCFLVSIPFGIWTLVVLADPQVKAFFQSRANQTP